MPVKVPEDVLRNIYELLLENAQIRESELRPAYRKRFGVDLDYPRLGFSNLASFMRTIPDTEVVHQDGALHLKRTKHTPKPKRQAAYPNKRHLTRAEQLAALCTEKWPSRLVKLDIQYPYCVECENLPLQSFFILRCTHWMCVECFHRRRLYLSTCICNEPLKVQAEAPKDDIARPLQDLLLSLPVRCAVSSCKRIATLEQQATHVISCRRMAQAGRKSALSVDRTPSLSAAQMKEMGELWEKSYQQYMNEVMGVPQRASTTASEKDHPSQKLNVRRLHIGGRLKVTKSWGFADIPLPIDLAVAAARLGKNVPTGPALDLQQQMKALLPVKEGQKVDILLHPGNSLYGFCLGQLIVPEENIFRVGWFPTRCVLVAEANRDSVLTFLECVSPQLDRDEEKDVDEFSRDDYSQTD